MANVSWAAPVATKTFKDPKSLCQVQELPGEMNYSIFKIYKGGEPKYTINCDCWVSVLFSPTGKYIALGNSEMGAFEEKANLMVYNCETGAKKTYIPSRCSEEGGQGSCSSTYAVPTEWSKDESSLKYKAHVDRKDTVETLVFDSKNLKP
jgi:hypothetical protein